MIDVICWKWKPRAGYRSQFGPESVNVLASMVSRHLRVPYRFSCLTDDARGIDSSVRIVPLWNDHASVPNPSSASNPSCYRRLKMFAPEAREIIGERIVSLDLDTVIVDDITPLFDRPEEFTIWGGQSVQPGSHNVYCWFNGSFMTLRAGTRSQVWTRFNPTLSPRIAHRAGCRGSDQGWIAYCLGKKEKILGVGDGIVSYRNHVIPGGGKLPAGARLVAFHGKHDPWHADVQRSHDWARKHYQ